MICLLRNQNNELTLHLEKGTHQVNFDNQCIQLEVNYPRSFQINHLFVHLFDEEIGYACFKKYKLVQEITIGSNSYSTIQIKSNHIESVHSIIDVDKKTIQNKYVYPVFINGKRNTKFHLFDVITILNCKIVIANDFIMINQCENCFVNLNEFKGKPLQIKSVNDTSQLKKKKRATNQKPYLHIKYRSFETVRQSEKQPLIFVVLPILIMSCASLLTGILIAYQGYMQGREIIEVLPSLILPIVMILGGLLIQPLQRSYENKKMRQKTNTYNEEITGYFEQLLGSVNSYELDLFTYEKASFLTSDEIVQDMFTAGDFFQNKNSLDESWLCIPLGYGNILSDITLDNTPQENNSFFYERHVEFSDRIKIFRNHTVYCDLSSSKNIVMNSIDMMVWFIFYMVTQIDSKEVQLNLIGDCRQIEELSHVVFFDHFKFNDKKLFFKSFTDYQNEKKESDKLQIIFNMTYEANLNDGNIWIGLFKGDSIPLYADTVIKDFQTKGSILTQRNKYKFTCIEHKHDLLKKLGDIHYRLNIKGMSNHQDKRDIISHDQLLMTDFIKEWKSRSTVHSLRIPIGVNKNGDLFTLDLHEKEHGPHMLIAATTGAGKSECIITILTSLAMTYSFEDVQFVIVDFKGGGLEKAFLFNNQFCPHFKGVISNLDEFEIVRFFKSIQIESKRRQVLFNKLCEQYNCSSMDISKYQEITKNNPKLEKIAHLFIVVDEFAELKTSYEEYSKELISIARIGRSLGIHLILSTQRPASVVDAQIWSNCRTRICLRVQDKQDSTEMISTDEAFYLKKPGQFYQYTDNVLTTGQFYYLNKEFDSLPFEVIDFSNKVYRFKKQSDGITICAEIIKKLVTYNLKTSKYLWQQPLLYLDKTLSEDINLAIGMIDDIDCNQQIPCIFKLNHTLFYCKSQTEIHQFIYTLLYAYGQSKDIIEVFILDSDNEFMLYNETSSYIHSINTEELFLNLFKFIETYVDKEKQLIILVPNVSIFIEMLQKFEMDFSSLLSKGLSNRCSYILFSYTTATISYSLWGYFSTRIASSLMSEQELSVIYEQRIKQSVHTEDFYYINESRLLLFKRLPITAEDVLKVSCKTNTKIHINEMITPCISYNINHIAKSYKTYEWIDMTNFPYLILIAKHKYVLQQYCSKLFQNEHLITTFKDFLKYDGGILFCDEIEVNNLQDLKSNLSKTKNRWILCIDSKHWAGNWIRDFSEDKYILWIGPGLNDQYIFPVSKKLNCSSDKGYFFHEGRGEVVKLIDECRCNHANSRDK